MLRCRSRRSEAAIMTLLPPAALTAETKRTQTLQRLSADQCAKSAQTDCARVHVRTQKAVVRERAKRIQAGANRTSCHSLGCALAYDRSTVHIRTHRRAGAGATKGTQAPRCLRSSVRNSTIPEFLDS